MVLNEGGEHRMSNPLKDDAELQPYVPAKLRIFAYVGARERLVIRTDSDDRCGIDRIEFTRDAETALLELLLKRKAARS